MLNKSSYTAASTIPAKLFCDESILGNVKAHSIKPYHVQVNPANSCPLSCGFCSCANREKDIEIDYDKLREISKKLILLGARAFTITGGGDPLAYSKLSDYVEWLSACNMQVSLVTNGVLFGEQKDTSFIDKLTWCRISLSDERSLRECEILPVIAENKKAVDFSFSYVVTTGRLDRITAAIEFANKHEFSHVRIVDDIIGGYSTTLDRIKNLIIESGIDCSRVIWQGRKNYTRGHKRCLISLLKPNIDVYGNVVPCCGVQYASSPPMLDYTRAFRVCDDKGIEKAYQEQRYFDGSICERCYYSDYNNILNAAWDSNELKHEKFV